MFWGVFKWSCALLFVAALAASPFYYRQVFFRVEEEVRARVESTIAARLPKLEIRVRSAHLASNGIEVRGLSVAEPGAVGPQPELAYFDEVFLECQTSLQELVAGDPLITGVKLSRPVIRATRRPDGQFSLSKLFPLPKSEGVVPPIKIENGTFEVFDPLKNPSSTFTLRDINLSLKPSASNPGEPKLLEVQGYLAADQVRRVEVVGTLDPSGGRWTLSGTADGLEISPELRSSLPDPIARSMEALKSLRAQANLSFRTSGDDFHTPPQFEVNGDVVAGRFDDPVLRNPLTDLKGTVHCDNRGIHIRDLTARYGSAVWEVPQFDRWGYNADSPLALRASGRQMRFDRGWGETLGEPWRTYWRDYDPEGDINLECSITFDGQRWKPVLHATCVNNVSFSCRKFPYRLERCRGTVTLNDTVLDVSVVAFSGAQPVNLRGRFFNPGPQYNGQLEIWGEKIQFDEKLFEALLKPKARDTLRSLNPRGTFEFHTRLWREPNDPLPRPEIHQHTRIVVSRCSMNYDKFQYPLNNLQGALEMRDGQWSTAPNLVGTNDAGVVTLTGNLACAGDRDVLSLHIDAKNAPLEEELRDALPPAHRELWNALRPQGNVDLQADVGYDSRVKKPTIDLTAVPRDDATSIGTSIEPVAFAYRLGKLGGVIHYKDGHIELKNMHAAHRNTQMRSGGWCDFMPNGSWVLHLEKFAVDRMRLQGDDHELVAALPEALRHAIAELRPTGPINLKGNLDFSKAAPGAPLRTGWDVELYLNQASLQVGPKVENIFGCVRLQGAAEGSRYASRGELRLDSLTYKNFQFTEILGPLWFDNANVYLGTLPQSRSGGQRSSRLTAKVFGGLVAADCHVKLGTVPQYRLIATVSGADLGQFAQGNLANHQKLNGKILANVDLHGSRGPHNLFGSGDIHLTEADVYELPLAVSLLKIVRAKRPDTTAFTQSDIAFEINGPHVLLKQIDLRGDAVSLSGDGVVTLDAQTNPIKLELHTTVGRGRLPILSGMFSEASQQIMKIHVDGTLDNPTTRTDYFPVATQALERLRTDYDNPFGPQGAAAVRATGGRQ